MEAEQTCHIISFYQGCHNVAINVNKKNNCKISLHILNDFQDSCGNRRVNLRLAEQIFHRIRRLAGFDLGMI
jgi:hypothetical protein